MTILPFVDVEVVTTNVEDNNDIFNNTVKQSFPYEKTLSHNGVVYTNYQELITINDYDSGGTYAIGDITYKDSFIKKLSATGTHQVPNQPEDYTVDINLDKSTWTHRYVQLGGAWDGYPNTDYTASVAIDASTTAYYSIYKTGNPAHFASKTWFETINTEIIDTGLVDPSSVTTIDTSGLSWNNISNVLTLNSSGASSNNAGANGGVASDILLTSNYDFSYIPDTATITGIEIQMRRKDSDDFPIYDAQIQLYQGATAKGTNASTGTKWGSSYSVKSFGGDGNFIGWDDITVADLKNSNFGVGVRASIGEATTAYIDSVQIKVYYTAPNTITEIINIDTPTVVAELLLDTIETKTTSISSAYPNYSYGINTIIVRDAGVYFRSNADEAIVYTDVTDAQWTTITTPLDLGFEITSVVNWLKPIDDKSYTVATSNNIMTYRVKTNGSFDSLVLANLKCSTLNVRFYDINNNLQSAIMGYEVDGSIDVRNKHPFEPTTEIFYNIINENLQIINTGYIEIDLYSTGAIELGTLMPTLSIDAGFTDLEVNFTINDYSPSEVKTGGYVDYVEGIATTALSLKFKEHITNIDKSIRRMKSLKKKRCAFDGADSLNRSNEPEIGLFSSTKVVGRVDTITAVTIRKNNDLDKYFSVEIRIVEAS